jgi:nucleoside-triphosphatase THEP1
MNNKNNIFIISGEVRTGKTLLISNVISALVKSKVIVKGVYSPARFEGNEKTGIYVEEISTGVRKLLADFQPGWDTENPGREWKMDPDALKWGDEILQRSIPTDALIIDELGYLEFEKNQGWLSAFEILESDQFKIALVVIRTAILKQALAKWPSAKIIHLDYSVPGKVFTEFLVNQTLATIIK